MKILLNGKERSFDFYRKGKFEQSIWNTIEIQNAPINTTVGNAHYSKINDPETHGHDGSHINLFLELVDNPYEKMSEFERYTQIYRATLNAVESNNAEASLNWISSHSSMTMESINGAHLNKGRLDLNVKVDMPPSAMLCRIERVKASRIPSFKRRIETGAIVKRTDDYQIRHGVSICDETRGENPMTISRLDDLFNSSLMDSLSEQYPQHYISNLESLGSEKVKMIVCRGDIPKSRQDYYRQCRKLEIENSHPVADQANWTVTDDREIFPDPLN